MKQQGHFRMKTGSKQITQHLILEEFSFITPKLGQRKKMRLFFKVKKKVKIKNSFLASSCAHSVIPIQKQKHAIYAI